MALNYKKLVQQAESAVRPDAIERESVEDSKNLEGSGGTACAVEVC